jgi:hypothetical protein
LLTLLIPTGALGGPVAALLRPFATSWRLATVPEAAGVSGRGAGGESGTPDAPVTAAVGTGLMDPAAAAGLADGFRQAPLRCWPPQAPGR